MKEYLETQENMGESWALSVDEDYSFHIFGSGTVSSQWSKTNFQGFSSSLDIGIFYWCYQATCLKNWQVSPGNLEVSIHPSYCISGTGGKIISAKPIVSTKCFLLWVSIPSDKTEFVGGWSALLCLWGSQNASFLDNEITGYYWLLIHTSCRREIFTNSNLSLSCS